MEKSCAVYQAWFLAQAQLPSLNGDSRKKNFHTMAASFRWPFSMFDQSYRERNDLQDLRDAIERAEEAVSASSSDSEEERERKEDILDTFRTKLEELEVETQKFKLNVCSAMSGEPLAQIRLKPTDSVLQLCEAVVKEMGEKNGGAVVSHSIIFQSEVLPQHVSLNEVGLRDGDTVYFARSPVRCLTASHDGSVCLWDFNESSSSEPHLRLRPGGALKSAQISSCGTLLALSTEDGGSGKLYCSETSDYIATLQGGCALAEFAPDGSRVVGIDSNGAAVIWCARSGVVLQRMFAPNASSQWDSDSDDDTEMSFAHFSPCGKMVVTAAGYSTQVWDTAGKLRLTLQGHQGSVRCTSFSSDSRYLLTASSDDTARIWSCETGKCLRILQGHQGALNFCSFSPNSLKAITAARDGTVKLWDFEEGLEGASCEELRTECSLSLEAEGGVVSSACFSPEGARLLMACASDTVRLVSATGQLQLSLEGLHEDWVRSATRAFGVQRAETEIVGGNVLSPREVAFVR
eukprot:s2624_g9.t1